MISIHQLQTSRVRDPRTFNRSGSQDVKISQSEQINGFMMCCTTQWLQLQINSSQKPQIELPIAVGLFLQMNAAVNTFPIHLQTDSSIDLLVTETSTLSSK